MPSGGSAQTPAPVSSGSNSGSQTPAPVNSGSQTPAPVGSGWVADVNLKTSEVPISDCGFPGYDFTSCCASTYTITKSQDYYEAKSTANCGDSCLVLYLDMEGESLQVPGVYVQAQDNNLFLRLNECSFTYEVASGSFLGVGNDAVRTSLPSIWVYVVVCASLGAFTI